MADKPVPAHSPAEIIAILRKALKEAETENEALRRQTPGAGTREPGTRTHTHGSDSDADTCEICFP